jgi:hypothetical protein
MPREDSEGKRQLRNLVANSPKKKANGPPNALEKDPLEKRASIDK